jgi:hypothetical protein
VSPEKVHIPDVVEPDSKLPQDLVALRRFAYYMDEAFTIPGTPIKVGLDAVIGLIPGVGDVIGGILSSWIVIGALRHRVPARIILRMIFNIGVDLTIGAVPLAGDVFDFLYEENVKNMRLLEKHRDRTRRPRSMAAIAFVASLIVLFIILMAVGMVAAVIALVFWIIGQRQWL